jgi:hypothetical protein
MSRWPEKLPDKPRKFQHIFKDADGVESVWKYDLDKFPNGPISVENKFPPHYEKALQKQQREAKLEKKKSTLELAKEGKLKQKKFW